MVMRHFFGASSNDSAHETATATSSWNFAAYFASTAPTALQFTSGVLHVFPPERNSVSRLTVIKERPSSSPNTTPK